MKRFLFLLVTAAILPAMAAAQETAKTSWRKSEDNWARKNSVTLTTSLFGFTNYNADACPLLPVFNIEYDRAIGGNLSVSAMGFYAKLDGRLATDTYTMEEKFWFAGAKLNYNLPLLRNWLYLRTGVGAGVGIHRPIMDYDFLSTADAATRAQYKKRVVAHGVMDLYLVFRATRRLEFKVSPLLISPSQIVVGSKFNAPDNDKTYLYWNPFGTLGMSVRL